MNMEEMSIDMDMDKISILVIEDNRLLREGIETLLKTQSDLLVVSSLGNGENIIAAVMNSQPKIVLLDLGLRDHSSLHIVKTILKKMPATKIIVMDLVAMEKDIYEFIKAGVSGFLLKDANIEDFYNAIRKVHAGEQILPPNMMKTLFASIVENAIHSTTPSIIVESVRMTKREQQVIQLIAEGYTNKEIAQKLNLSAFTVKSHVHNILEKLSLQTRVQVANYAHIYKSYRNADPDVSLIEE